MADKLIEELQGPAGDKVRGVLEGGKELDESLKNLETPKDLKLPVRKKDL